MHKWEDGLILVHIHGRECGVVSAHCPMWLHNCNSKQPALVELLRLAQLTS